MKRILLLIMVILMAVSTVFATAEEFAMPRSITKNLNVAYAYKKDLYYRFVFTDIQGGKDGSFDDLFNNSNIDWIKMSTLDNGKLKNDTPLYVSWMVDEMTPIEKLTIEIPAPLMNENNEKLDWYASIDGKHVIGGKFGYGDVNALTIFERNPNLPIVNMAESLPISLYTESVAGKKAGDYIGSIVLKVYGGI